MVEFTGVWGVMMMEFIRGQYDWLHLQKNNWLL